MKKRALKVGTVIPISVGQEHINDSDPCNKDNCMLSRASIAKLVADYGGKESDYHVKSTNHGIIFRLDGREYVCVFDNSTGTKIFRYDQAFRTKRSKEAARATVKPFKARLMIEATKALPKWPAMAEATKAKLRSYARKTKTEYQPKKSGSRRELSL